MRTVPVSKQRRPALPVLSAGIGVLLLLLAGPRLSEAGPVQVVRPGEVRVQLQEGVPAVTTVVAEPDLLVSYEPPPKPGPSYECKRADLDSLTAVGSYDIVVPAQPGRKLTKDEACLDPKEQRPLRLPTKEIPRLDNVQRSKTGTPPTKTDVASPKTLKRDTRDRTQREQERETVK